MQIKEIRKLVEYLVENEVNLTIDFNSSGGEEKMGVGVNVTPDGTDEPDDFEPDDPAPEPEDVESSEEMEEDPEFDEVFPEDEQEEEDDEKEPSEQERENADEEFEELFT